MSDDYEQTYLAQDENRDGDEVNGQYSFVDPNGSLITVKYTADESGWPRLGLFFSQEREERQEPISRQQTV